jgi:pilus assembly protein Flp/PilA
LPIASIGVDWSIPDQKTSMIRSCLNATIRFLKEEDGPTAVEYAVMLSMILGLCIAAVGQLAASVGTSFNESSAAINTAIGN